MPLTLLATCDFHSNVPGAVGTLAALARGRRAGALIIDAGDFFGGNAFHEWSQGRIEELLLADLYDAVVPGNHDLADLMRLRRPELFPPVVCCNLTPPAGFAGRWESSLLLPRRDLQVGVVGLLGAQAFAAVPADEKAGFTFTEPRHDLLAGEAERLLSRGADVVIGVSHSGFAHDVARQRADSPFPVIIAGHCHSENYYWATPTHHVVKAPDLGRGLARIDLSLAGEHTFAVEHHPAVEQAMAKEGLAAVTAALTEYRRWGAGVLGTMASPIGDRHELAAVLVETARTLCRTGAFLLNLPTLRAGLPATVTRQRLADAAPFDSPLVRLASHYDLVALVGRAAALGEQPVTAADTDSATTTVATTAYLADRLGLPAEPVEPRLTVRTVITSLFGSTA